LSVAELKSLPLTDGCRIILLDWQNQAPTFCNLQKLDASGCVIWEAVPQHVLEGVWTEARLENGRLLAYNYAGYQDIIDCETGRIIERTFVK
jgi:hypothetical protein